ncbi:hypothetical protein RHMOL_Rhmol03G0187300 [Rhododendron molle]|uniref:Uncharacterized protein n=1 Tax=Rhododendron molle TaxID=49168 RepID=A0ACC0PH85_RHOML|nr:hypothetical protein RHMOL_Rhmol03G0187300 [Rhododendron molle]
MGLEEWVFSAIYGSPNPVSRDILWYDLQEKASRDNRALLLAGDFNDHMESSERRSFRRGTSYHRCNKFSHFVNSCNFTDLGCVGPKLTWSNNREGMANTMVRLDRELCNSAWNVRFPETVVKNLPRVYSDHCPFLIFMDGIPMPSPRNRPFRFEDAWSSHPDFINIVKEAWADSHKSFSENLDKLTDLAKVWNKEVFGNIFFRKKHLLARLEGIQRSQSLSYSHNLCLLEKDLNRLYQDTLKQEETLWFQKSRAKWIVGGDQILSAVKNIGAFKAPGPDGYQAVFYHKWCGNSILADSHVNITLDHLKVADFITSSKDWNCTLLNQVINANSLS